MNEVPKNNETINNSASTDRALGQAAMKDLQKTADGIIASAPSFAKNYFREVRELERDFVKRNEAIISDGGSMSQKEFERWEDELDTYMAQGEHQVKLGKLNFDEEGEVKAEIVTFHEEKDLAKTIEAQAGNFFYERERELELKLRESGTPEEIRYLHDFYQSVEAHLDFKYMSREEKMDYGDQRYERNRTEAHNNAIKHLNGINDLARKYGTRPFTVRNFWPSDMRERNAQTPGMAEVMRYDRDLVEEYYAIAFKSDVMRRQAKLEREIRMGLF